MQGFETTWGKFNCHNNVETLPPEVVKFRQKYKTDPLAFTFFLFQSSNFQFCQFSPLTFNFCQFKAPLQIWSSSSQLSNAQQGHRLRPLPQPRHQKVLRLQGHSLLVTLKMITLAYLFVIPCFFFFFFLIWGLLFFN